LLVFSAISQSQADKRINRQKKKRRIVLAGTLEETDRQKQRLENQNKKKTANKSEKEQTNRIQTRGK
jgi:predicted alpha/beta superfamily hydrolase